MKRGKLYNYGCWKKDGSIAMIPVLFIPECLILKDNDASYFFAAVCEDFEARILIGDGQSYVDGAISVNLDYYIDDALSIGRIEICFGGLWRALCSDGWSQQDASVTCQQLGFAGAG